MTDRKVVQNKGKTAGGDELLVLDCGHSVILDDFHSDRMVYAVGETVYCYECEKRYHEKTQPK